MYGGVDGPLRVVASGQAEGGHANCGCYGPGRARADPGVVMLGKRYDGRGMLCCELKRARGRIVGEENNPLRAVCQHFLECQQLVALSRKDDRDVLGPPRNVPRGGGGGGLRTSLSSGWLNQSTVVAATPAQLTAPVRRATGRGASPRQGGGGHMPGPERRGVRLPGASGGPASRAEGGTRMCAP